MSVVFSGCALSGVYASRNSWYLAPGIDPSTVIAAWQPKGAASLSDSYVNIANPGTHDLTVGNAPNWDAVNGQKYTAASSHYLKTGIIPTANTSVIIRISNGVVGGIFFGSDDSGITRYLLLSMGVLMHGSNTGIIALSPAISDGVLGVSGNKGYVNGVEVGDLSGWSGTSTMPMYIGCRNSAGTANLFSTFYLQAAMVTTTSLTALQQKIIAAQMASL